MVTEALVPVALMFKLRAVPSLFNVPLLVIWAVLPLADNLASLTSVIAPE